MKYDGTSAVRSVTSIVPADPLCAVPLPSAGSSVNVPWLLAVPASTMRSPNVDCGPRMKVDPAPPRFDPELAPLACSQDGTTLASSLYSMAIAPPPPLGLFDPAPPRTSIAP